MADAACGAQLYLDGAGSVFDLEVAGSASGLQGLTLNVEPAFEEQRKGMLGTLELESEARCPTDSSQLGRLWPSARLASRDDAPLKVYPGVIALQIPSLVELNLTDLLLSWDADRFSSLRGGEDGEFSMETDLKIVGGMVVYSAPTLGLNGTEPVVNYTASSTVKGSMMVNETSVSLMARDMNFKFVLAVEGPEVVGDIVLNITLNGSIEAAGAMGCNSDCGVNGRCEIDGSEGAETCACSCGWTGQACDVPSGFCPRFSGFDSRAAPAPVAESKVREEPRELSEEELAARCAELATCGDDRQRPDSGTGRCVCIPGWSGENCDMCQTNDACNAYLDATGASCKQGFAYEGQTSHKVYDCDLSKSNQATLTTFIGKSLGFKCNTTLARRNVSDGEGLVGNSAFCDVNFRYQNVEEVECRAWGCRVAVDSPRVQCDLVNCQCKSAGGCSSVINSTSSNIKSIMFQCDARKECKDCEDDQQQCSMEFGGLGLDVEAPCRARECFDPNGEYLVGDEPEEGDGNHISVNVLIIAIPTALVLGLGILVGVPGVLLVRNMSTPPSTVQAQSRKHTKSAVSEIVFYSVGCAVPIFGAAAERQLLNARRTEDDDLESSSSVDDGLGGRTSSSRSQELIGLNSALVTMMTEGKRGYRSVLHGVTGLFRQGELIGVMGPSGSGKTTFLSILSNVAVDGSSQRTVRGEILVNGRRQGSWLKRVVAFVPQEDKLLPTLTVKEAVMYSAILRLPGADWATIHGRTQDALQELGLDGVEKSLVGGVRGLRGISGGERRRVTIGMELVTDPSIVIMDEPLSGLDSFTALNLMDTLKRVSSAGRVVVLSMHQPAPAMFHMLDQVLLLARGFQVYLGPPDRAGEYFADHGFPCPDSLPISEHMLKAVSNPHTLTTLLNRIGTSAMRRQGADANINAEVPVDAAHLDAETGASKLPVLVWRGFVDIVRNPSLLLSHVVVAVLIGVMCGVIFWDADLDIQGAQNRLGGIFFLLAFLGFSASTTIDLFHSERDIAAREIKAGYYSAVTYLTSKLILDALLLRIIPALLLGIPVYLMMGLQSVASKVFIYIFTVNTFNLVIGALAMVITILSATPGTASLIINTVLLISLLFAGHLVHIPSIPGVVRWIHWLSVYSYAFQALAVNEFLGLEMNFTVPNYASVDGIDGKVFLATIGIDSDDLREDLILLSIFYAASVVLVFLSMRFSMWLQRGKKIKIFRRHPAGYLAIDKSVQMKKFGEETNENSDVVDIHKTNNNPDFD